MYNHNHNHNQRETMNTILNIANTQQHVTREQLKFILNFWKRHGIDKTNQPRKILLKVGQPVKYIFDHLDEPSISQTPTHRFQISGMIYDAMQEVPYNYEIARLIGANPEDLKTYSSNGIQRIGNPYSYTQGRVIEHKVNGQFIPLLQIYQDSNTPNDIQHFNAIASNIRKGASANQDLRVYGNALVVCPIPSLIKSLINLSHGQRPQAKRPPVRITDNRTSHAPQPQHQPRPAKPNIEQMFNDLANAIDNEAK